MLVSSLASPRRLALLALFVFVVAIIFLQSSPYREYLPNARIPGFSSDSNGKSSLEEDQQGSGRIETPGDTLRVPEVNDEPRPKPGQSRPTRHGSSSASSTLLDAATPTTLVLHSPAPTTVQPSSAVIQTAPGPHASHKEIQSWIQDIRQTWTPPYLQNHWPPYDWYADHNYDPNRWEGFDWENDFYINNGIDKLASETPAAATPVPYLPYPKYNSEEWRKGWKGEYVACEGPRGKRLNESAEDAVKAYPAMLAGFPNVAVGDANATGLDIGHCFDRYHRFGPYGYAQADRESVGNWDRPVVKPDWTNVHWGQLQDDCLVANKDRYRLNAREPIELHSSKSFVDAAAESLEEDKGQLSRPQFKPRTALLIRAWGGYTYADNDLEAVRALITELSLQSGGEYQVFLLVNIKGKKVDLTDKQVYQKMLEANVPQELQDITILWHEKFTKVMYPKVGDWQVYWHQFMPLQWFSKLHPEFDFVWNWETDARYIGNHYHFLEQMSAFARKRPRKYLWERNSRFYFPAAHGTWEQWLNDTDATIEAAVRNESMQTVWGPQPYDTEWQTPIGPQPPHTEANDTFQWGVGEEADLITLQPIWDPTHTEWTFKNKIWNFLPGIRPHFSKTDPMDDEYDHPDFKKIPRRTYINTLSRFSKRQLHAMHVENTIGRTMQSEMWPATVALQHGLKAVYAPHPIWTDRKWPAWYMDAIFNADGGELARWGQRGDSVYNHDREHNFGGWSWYYKTEFPWTLYWRWLGWSANVGPEEQYPNNPLRVLGGSNFEEDGVTVHLPGSTADGSQAAPAGSSFGGREMKVGGNGRMCLPPMLLHPIKKVFEDASGGYDQRSIAF